MYSGPSLVGIVSLLMRKYVYNDINWCRLEFTMMEFSMNLCHGMELLAGKLINGVTGTYLQRMNHIW